MQHGLASSANLSASAPQGASVGGKKELFNIRPQALQGTAAQAVDMRKKSVREGFLSNRLSASASFDDLGLGGGLDDMSVDTAQTEEKSTRSGGAWPSFAAPEQDRKGKKLGPNVGGGGQPVLSEQYVRSEGSRAYSDIHTDKYDHSQGLLGGSAVNGYKAPGSASFYASEGGGNGIEGLGEDVDSIGELGLGMGHNLATDTGLDSPGAGAGAHTHTDGRHSPTGTLNDDASVLSHTYDGYNLVDGGVSMLGEERSMVSQRSQAMSQSAPFTMNRQASNDSSDHHGGMSALSALGGAVGLGTTGQVGFSSHLMVSPDASEVASQVFLAGRRGEKGQMVSRNEIQKRAMTPHADVGGFLESFGMSKFDFQMAIFLYWWCLVSCGMVHCTALLFIYHIPLHH